METLTKKYEYTGETITTNCGVTLHRIRRLSDGVVGGWIESEANLSHEGNAWVGDNAVVSGNAWVEGDAVVTGDAWVGGDAVVEGNERITMGVKR